MYGLGRLATLAQGIKFRMTGFGGETEIFRHGSNSALPAPHQFTTLVGARSSSPIRRGTHRAETYFPPGCH